MQITTFFAVFCVFVSASVSAVHAEDVVVKNPQFRWRMHPPVAWTYPSEYADECVQYFPGQPLTEPEAQATAERDLKAAMFEALIEAGASLWGIRIAPEYVASEVSDCVKVAGVAPAPTTNNIGTQVGVVQNGTVTQMATLTGAVDPASCVMHSLFEPTKRDYVVSASVMVGGAWMSQKQAEAVDDRLRSILEDYYHVRIVGEIQLS